MEIKELKKKQKSDNFSIMNLKIMNLSETVKSHKKEKTEKLDKLRTFKNDMSQIRYYFKNESLDSKRKANLDEIEQLQIKEKEILEKLKHTLERQDRIEREVDSPIKIRRAPSLTNQAKFSMLQNKFADKSKVYQRMAQNDDTFSGASNIVSFKY